MWIIIAIIIGIFIGLWFGKRAAPAFLASILILATPFWLLIGLTKDILRALFGKDNAPK